MLVSFRFTILLALLFTFGGSGTAQQFRLLRSLSGTTGTVAGNKFKFDETRTRFVFPQDSSLIVYFEWDAPAGSHSLTGLWKSPDGRVSSISPDVKIETTTTELTCYWTYLLDAHTVPGVWTLEVKIDGQPAGSHNFEVAGTSLPAPPVQLQERKRPTLDEIFRQVRPSLVWIRKLDSDRRRLDTALGFIAAQDRIVTALQAVDGARQLEIEFADGKTVQTDQLIGWSRTGDWAELATPTGSLAPLVRGDPAKVAVGDRLIGFNVEIGSVAIGGVDISGRQNVPGYGPRFQLSPALPVETAGGPLLDLDGHVVGILGGSITPGMRFGGRKVVYNMTTKTTGDTLNRVTPITELTEPQNKPATLIELLAARVLTEPVLETPELMYATITKEMTKSAGDPWPASVSDLSMTNSQAWVMSEWVRKGKESKGIPAIKIYDDQNRLRNSGEPKKLNLLSVPTRVGFGFSPTQLGPGLFRVDLEWNDRPVWRTFITISR